MSTLSGDGDPAGRTHLADPKQARRPALVSVPAGEEFIAAQKAAAAKEERSAAVKAGLWGGGIALAATVTVVAIAGGVNRTWDRFVGNDVVPANGGPTVVAGPPQDGSVEISPDHPPVSVAFGEGGTIIGAADRLAVPGQEDEAVQALLRANGGSDVVQPDQVAVLDQDTGEAQIITPDQTSQPG